MRQNLGKLVFFSMLFFCSQAEAKIFIKPFDSIGVRASGDITTVCDSGKIWKSSGAGIWACADDSTGAGANISVKENDTIISSSISVDDYGVGFDATQNPTGEINISLDLTEVTANQGPLTVAGGGTNKSSVSDDAVLVGNAGATGYDQPALPSCQDSSGNHLNYNATNNAFSCGTTTSQAPVTLAGDTYLTLAGQQITANDVPLTTNTSGNYVGTVSTSSPLAGGAVGSEGTAISLSIQAANASQNGYMPAQSMISIDNLVSVSHAAVTLAGQNYLSLSSQQITANAINLSGTNITSTLGLGNGGTGLTSISNDAVLIGNPGGTGFDRPVIADSDGATQKLQYDQTLGVFSAGTDDDIPEAADYSNLSGGNAINVATVGTVSWDTVTVSQDALSSVVSSPSGFQTISGRATLIQGCSNGQILKWNETADIWECNTDTGGTDLSAETFITQANTGNLSAERALTGGNAVLLIDGGANSSMTVSWDTVTVSQDALSSVTVTPSGFQTISGRATLLQGCSDGQILKWAESTDTWGCAADTGGSGSPGGSSAQLQYNNAGAFGGTSGVSWDGTSILKIADAVSFDLSSINSSSATEGFRIPTAVNNLFISSDGQLAWSISQDKLFAGTGTASKEIGKPRHYLFPETAQFLSTNFPQYNKVNGTNFPVSGLAYDATTDEAAFWKFEIKDYTGGNLTLDIYWYADTATTANVVWESQITAITPNTDSTDVETDTLATLNFVQDTHLGTVGQRLHQTYINITNLDSLADGDIIWVRLARDANSTNATDDMTGDAILVYAVLSY